MNVVERNTKSDVAVVQREDCFHCLCCSLTGSDRFVLHNLPELVAHLQDHADAGDLVPLEVFQKLSDTMHQQIARFENRSRLILAITVICGAFTAIHLMVRHAPTPGDLILGITITVGLSLVVALT